MLYSELLQPSYVAWILSIGGDPFQHYIGWELFRASPWTFPVGIISNLAYPVGIPVTFTDSIPLFSIFFKLFRAWLPFPFQFDGIWMLMCFTLQGLFGYLLLERILRQKVLAVIGSVFFILSPIMLFRLGGHSALGAHWLILWSLFLAFEKEGLPRMGQWTAMLAISLLVHPYLFFMCAAVFLGDVVRRVFVNRAISFKRAGAWLFGNIAMVLLLSYGIGMFSAGGGAASGYGVFSLDLNSLVNPYHFSTILQDMRVREPNEGFNYLGLGIILLGILSLVEYLRTGERRFKIVLSAWWPLAAVLVLLSIVAITNIVSAWGAEILHIPMPVLLRDHLFGIVRSSGRLFWPVYCCIVLGSFYIIKRARYPLACGLLIAALCLQAYDMKDRLRALDGLHEEKTWESPLTNSFWKDAAERYEHISFVPTFAHGRYEPIALFAAEQSMTLNTGYVVRSAGQVNEREMKKEQQRLAEGRPDPDTLYIFLDSHPSRPTIDGYSVLAP